MRSVEFRTKLEKAYDPEAFRKLGHALVDRLADYYQAVLKGEVPLHPWMDPEARDLFWKDSLDQAPADPLPVLEQYIAQSQHVHHPGYVGHQMGVPPPLTALADLATSALNNSAAIYEMGPSGTMIERAVTRWMAGLVGYGPESDGIFTSGGTLGNLTALLAARQSRAGGDPWAEGTREKLCFLVSGQAHYSVDRAARIMGWGEQGIEKVDVDGEFRLRPDRLQTALDSARKKGRKVIGVVASCCSTSTGSYDPIPPIADFCMLHDLWLHVDGAHGAAAAVTEKYRSLVEGIERADSIVWDAHKMLLSPALTTVVLFKRREDSIATFPTQASYIFQKSAGEEWYNLCHRTLECTKRDFTFRLYLLLKTYGPEIFSEYVTRQYDLARSFATVLRGEKDFELLLEPQSNIVCFRHLKGEGKERDQHQARVRQELLKGGKFYCVQTTMPTGIFLRTTLMNPFTSEDKLRGLLEEIRRQ